MEQDIMTFGEALGLVIKSQKTKLTLDKLRQAMGIKSNTTITRILRDESSFQNIESFYNSLLEKKILRLSEHEKRLLASALEVSRIGKTRHLINRELMNFIVEQQDSVPWICSDMYGTANTSIFYLSDLFNTYSDYSDIKIFLFNCAYNGIVSLVLNCLRSFPFASAEHYIASESNQVRAARQFISILPIVNHSRYQCYHTYSAYHSDFEVMNRFNNSIVVIKTNKTGKTCTDIISLKDKNLFSLLYDEPGEHFAQFYLDMFSDMSTQYDKLKEFVRGSNLIDNVISISKTLLSFEEQWEQILIKPHLCFYNISADNLMKLLKDESVDQRKISELYDIHEKRYLNYCTIKRHHIGIYSKRGIMEFLQTGRFSDHIPLIRPLTVDEAKAAIRSVIEVCEKNPMNHIYLLKADINYNYYQYLFYGRNTMCFCDNDTDYSEMDFSYIINSHEIANMMYDFVKKELIPKHCHTQSQSLEILHSLIS